MRYNKSMAIVKNIRDLVYIALKAKKTKEISVCFQVDIDNDTWQAYTAYIGYREISLNCDRGTCSYVIDTYGDKHTIELVETIHA